MGLTAKVQPALNQGLVTHLGVDGSSEKQRLVPPNTMGVGVWSAVSFWRDEDQVRVFKALIIPDQMDTTCAATYPALLITRGGTPIKLPVDVALCVIVGTEGSAGNVDWTTKKQKGQLLLRCWISARLPSNFLVDRELSEILDMQSDSG